MPRRHIPQNVLEKLNTLLMSAPDLSVLPSQNSDLGAICCTYSEYDSSVPPTKDSDRVTKFFPGKYPLHFAIEFGDIDLVSLLIKKGININALDDENYTPLQTAIIHCKIEIVHLLLDKGASVSQKGGNSKETALHIVASMENVGLSIAIARLLFNKGADIYAEDDEGQTAFHTAAQTGNTALTDFFLEKGININSLAKEQNTALHLAASMGQWNSVRLLLDRGADFRLENKFLFVSQDEFSSDEDENEHELLIDEDETISIIRHTPLINAIRNQSPKTAYLLLQPDINQYEHFESYGMLDFGIIKKITVLFNYANGTPEALNNHDPQYFNDIKLTLLQSLSFGHIQQNANWAQDIFKFYWTSPYIFYVKQFEFRQKLLDQVTHYNPKVRWLWWVISLQCDMEMPWLTLFIYLRKLYPEVLEKASTLNWYSAIPNQNYPNVIGVQLEKQCRDFISKKLFEEIKPIDVLIANILKLPQELQWQILKETIPEKFFQLYEEALPSYSGEYKRMNTLMESHKEDVHNLYEWSSIGLKKT